MKEYGYAIHIQWEGLGEQNEYKEYTKKCAQYLGWQCEFETGDEQLFKNLLNGKWEEDGILVVPPGKTIKPSFDEQVLAVGELEELDESILKSNVVSGQQ